MKPNSAKMNARTIFSTIRLPTHLNVQPSFLSVPYQTERSSGISAYGVRGDGSRCR
jgi:hypothetical protein